MKSQRTRCAAALCALFAAAVLAGSYAPGAHSQNGKGRGNGAANSAKAETLPGFDVASIDRNASACQDFNQFANGGWIAKNTIPAAYSRWGRFESDSRIEWSCSLFCSASSSKRPQRE